MARPGKRWLPSIPAGQIWPRSQFWNPWPDQPARSPVNLPVKGDEKDKTTPELMRTGARSKAALNTPGFFSKKGRPL